MTARTRNAFIIGGWQDLTFVHNTAKNSFGPIDNGISNIRVRDARIAD